MLLLVGEFYLWAGKRLFVVNFHNFPAQRSSEWSFARELIVEKLSAVWDTCAILWQVPRWSACIYIAKEHSRYARWSITQAAGWVGDLFLHKLPLFQSLLYLSSSLFLSCRFCTDTCRWAHTSGEPTSEKCNLSISAAQREDKQCWRNEGINTSPRRCWTNMSRRHQFTNGPAMFGAHRCGNPRTNRMAPVADVVPGFVCSPSSSPYCLADLVLEGRVLLKWQQRDENKRKDSPSNVELAEENRGARTSGGQIVLL